MITAEIQRLATSEFVSLYTLDLSGIAPDLPVGEQLLRFTPMVNELGQPIVWQGHVFTPYPIESEGFDVTAQGSPPRPKLRAANLDGVLSDLCLAYNDLVLAKLTRIKTFARFLDAVNFVDGNPEADADQHYPLEVFSIERKTEENDIFIEWELRWPYDLQGVLLPGRPIAQNLCPTLYKSPDCGWVPVEGHYFNQNDQPCSLVDDDCSQALTGCRLRFGAKNSLPFGGFPGAGMVRQ
ncbi:MAG: phage minor tail protein L [Methylovulum sp.]|nr:phage minor tail protein L [Methylovulum sp.]